MGLLDWLFGKPKKVKTIDHVWINQDAKFDGLFREVKEQLAIPGTVLVVAHFPATLARLREELHENELNYKEQPNRLTTAELLRVAGSEDATPILIHADALDPDDFPNPMVEDLAPIHIAVAERHFLPSLDDPVVEFAESLGRPCNVCFHLSLKDPLLRLFTGEWIERVLIDLGMTESEPIESGLVSKRIRAAQKQLEKRVIVNKPADSAEDWLELNG